MRGGKLCTGRGRGAQPSGTPSGSRPVPDPCRASWRLAGLALVLAVLVDGAGHAERRALLRDDFATLAPWQEVVSTGVELELGIEGGSGAEALRLDVDFAGRAGWAGARRELALELPDEFELLLVLRGAIPPNTLEVKLLDPSGENVWWARRPSFEFPADVRRLRFKRRHFEFAWGPAGGGELRAVGAIEIVVTAAEGGRGTVWLEELEIAALPPRPSVSAPPRARASSSLPGQGPERVLDGDRATAWRPAGARAWLELDFGAPRELGGLVLRWAAAAAPRGYTVVGADEGGQGGERGETTELAAVDDGDGGDDWLYLPESDVARLRLVVDGCPETGCALEEIEVLPLAAAATPNDFFARLAAEAPRGAYPRAFSGEQSYWTVVGADAAPEEALLDEDGRLELAAGGPSLEPFLEVDGRLLTWADVATRHSLAEDELPVPTVSWRAARDGLALDITAFADGPLESSVLWARYRLRTTAEGQDPRSLALLLALRPLQVNPPQQFLGTPGGAARVGSVACRERALDWTAGGARGARGRVAFLVAPSACGAAALDQGGLAALLAGRRPLAGGHVDDPRRWASALARFDLRVRAGESLDIWIAAPLAPGASPLELPADPTAAATLAETRLRAALARWRARLAPLELRLPGPAAEHARTLRATLGWILVHRDRAALQPGSRAYQRSWIRDGALTSWALLRAGLEEDARAFVEWYAQYQEPSGRVPCCVDARGADPVPEHDSHGQLVFAVAQVFRHTGDREFLERMYPHVARAVAHLDALRAERRTAEYRARRAGIFFGLLPESISHEGYSAKPVHSYWDDFFGLRGYEDAVDLAEALGRAADARRFAASRDEFAADLHASVGRAIAAHGIDYLPGSADLGDFDPTSTTIALAPGGLLERLPRAALERTFTRYWEEFVARRQGSRSWDAYTPYELRNVGAFVRLGWRGRAHELLAWFFDHRRPAGWRQWAEVVGREARAPRFLGDMPHGWVGSDYVRSLLDLFAYERESDEALVLAAGVPEAWLADGGCAVRGLRTPYGVLDLALERRGERLAVEVGGTLTVPPGGLVLLPPGRFTAASLGGRPMPLAADGSLTLRALPVSVELR